MGRHTNNHHPPIFPIFLLLALVMFPALAVCGDASDGFSEGALTTGTDIELIVGPSSDTVVEIPLGHTGLPLSVNMTLEPLPYTLGGDDVPSRPFVDIFNDGTIDWIYSGLGHGRAGLQTEFWNGTKEIVADLMDGPLETDILLPSSAHVRDAIVSVNGWRDGRWWDEDWGERVTLSVTAGSRTGNFSMVERVGFGPDCGDIINGSRVVTFDERKGAWTEVHFAILDRWLRTDGTWANVAVDVATMEPRETRTYEVYFDNPKASRSKMWSDMRVGSMVNVLGHDVPIPANFGSQSSLGLSGPGDMAMDSRGRIHIADTLNDRILTIDGSGRILDQIASGGPDGYEKELDHPYGVAVDKDDRILVADTFNCRVLVFDSAGRYQQFLGNPGRCGSSKSEMMYPWGITVDLENRVYVADAGNHRVLVFDDLGDNLADHVLAPYGVSGDGDKLNNPRGVAVGDSVYVADYLNKRVQVYGSRASVLPANTLGTGIVQYPNDVAFSSKDGLLVADTYNDRIAVLGTTGGLTRTVDGLYRPRGLGLGNAGEMLIADTGNNRIIRFIDAVASVSQPEAKGIPSDVRLTADDEVLWSSKGDIDGTRTVQLAKTPLRNAISKATPFIDRDGNEMVKLHVNITSATLGHISLTDLWIRYNMSANISADIPTTMDPAYISTGEIMVRAGSGSGGRLMLEDIDVLIDAPPVVLRSAPTYFEVLEESPPFRLVSLGDAFLDEGPLNFDIISDEDACISLSLDDGDGILIDAEAAVNWTGTFNVTVTAMDIYGQSSDPYGFKVKVTQVNDPPIIVGPFLTPARVGEDICLDITVEDSDDGPNEINLSIIDGPVDAFIDGKGRLHWTSMEWDVGTVLLVLEVSDGETSTCSTIFLEVTEAALPLSLVVPEDMAARTGQEIELTLLASGGIGNYSFHLPRRPLHMTVDVQTGWLQWTPSEDQVGDNLVEALVDDGQNTTRASFIVKVTRERPTCRVGPMPTSYNIGDDVKVTGTAVAGHGSVQWVEYRIDSGKWKRAKGTERWNGTLELDGLGTGRHILQARAFDGMYSEPAAVPITLDGRREGAGKWSVANLLPPMIVVVLFMIGGVLMTEKGRKYVYGKILVGRKKGASAGKDAPQARLTSVDAAGCTATVTIEADNWPVLGSPGHSESQRGEEPDDDLDRIVVLPRSLALCGKRGSNSGDRDAPKEGGDGAPVAHGGRGGCGAQDKPRCFLCLGRVKEGEGHIECEWCGRVYHRACARRVGRCPQCGDELLEKD